MTKFSNFKASFMTNGTSGLRGYTLLEIMISVTLMLMMMYGVAAIFSRVGGVMNETQSTMEMTNALRNARNRLERDLKSVSVPLVPPRNSNSGEGYFSYIEGLGVPYSQVNYNTFFKPSFADGTTMIGNTAENVSRFIQRGSIFSEFPYDVNTNQFDTTVGDVDDILMFTVKAPAGQSFRGRFGQFVEGTNASTTDVEMIESEYAEVIWFLRGTTLYRRILLIVPNATLQDRMTAMVAKYTNNNALGHPAQVKLGYGFYHFYDVSIHLDITGKVVANTLGDLSNRANRYGYWRSMVNLYLNNSDKTAKFNSAWSPYGAFGAWYHLRMPTLQESATYKPGNANNYSFQAGVPFGNIANNTADAEWWGNNQALTNSNLTGGNSTVNIEFKGVANTNMKCPIDFWSFPNCWDQVSPESGDLNQAATLVDGLTFMQDVVLTNVISFDVKAWDPKIGRYVNLAEFPYGARNSAYGNLLIEQSDQASCLASLGNYGGNYYYNIVPFGLTTCLRNPVMPAVYDTWSEQYEVEYLSLLLRHYYANGADSATLDNIRRAISDISLNGKVTTEQLKNFPPPYEAPLKAIQVEMRVFDPRSRNIRNMSLQVDFKNGQN